MSFLIKTQFIYQLYQHWVWNLCKYSKHIGLKSPPDGGECARPGRPGGGGGGGPQRSAPCAALQQQRAGLGYELHQSLLEGSRRLASALAAALTARMMTNTCKTHRSTNPARNVSGNCHFVDIYNIQFIISLPVLIKYVRHKSKIMLLVCTIFMVGPCRTGTERIIYYYLYVYLVLMTK